MYLASLERPIFIFAYSWARPAVLAAGKGRRGMFLCLATKKVAGYYVIPSEILSVGLFVHQRPHHSSACNSSYSFRPILFKLYRCF